MSKKFKYFVSFSFSGGESAGFGNVIVTIDEPLTTERAFRHVQESIQKDAGDKIIILSWALLEG